MYSAQQLQAQYQQNQQNFVEELFSLLGLGDKLLWSLFFFVKEENKFDNKTLLLSDKEDLDVLQRLESVVKFVSVHVTSFISRFTTTSHNGDRIYLGFLQLLVTLRDMDVIIMNNTQFFLNFIAGFVHEKDLTSLRVPHTSRPASITMASSIVVPSTSSSSISVADQRLNSSPHWHGSPPSSSPQGNSSGSSSKGLNLTNSGGEPGVSMTRSRKNTFSNRISIKFTGKSFQLPSSGSSQYSSSGNATSPLSTGSVGSPQHNPLSDAKPIAIKRNGNAPQNLAQDYASIAEWFAFAESGCGPCLGYLKRVLPPQTAFWSELIEYSFRLLSSSEADFFMLMSERNVFMRGMAICFYFADVPAVSLLGSNNNNNSLSGSNNGSSGIGIDNSMGGGGGGGMSIGDSMYSPTIDGSGPGMIDEASLTCNESIKKLFEKSITWFRKYPYYPVCNGGYADCLPATLLAGLPTLGRLIPFDIPEQAAALEKSGIAKSKELNIDDYTSVETAIGSIGPKISNSQSMVSLIMKVLDGLNNLIASSNTLSNMLLANSFTTNARLVEKAESIFGPQRWESLYSEDITTAALRIVMYIKGFQARVVRLPRAISQNALATLYEEIGIIANRSQEYNQRLQRAGVDIVSPSSFTVNNARVAVYALIEGIAGILANPGSGEPYVSDLALRHIKHLYGLVRFFDIFNEYANLATLWFIDPSIMPNVKPAGASLLGMLSTTLARTNVIGQRGHGRSLSQKGVTQQPQAGHPTPLSLDPSSPQITPTSPTGTTSMQLQQQQGSSSPGQETVFGIGPAQKEHMAQISNFYGEFPPLVWASPTNDDGHRIDEFFDKCRYITYTYKVLAKDILGGMFVSSQIILLDYVYSDARLLYSRHCPRMCSILDSEYTRKPQGLCSELGRGFVDVSVRLLCTVMPRDSLEESITFLLACADVIPVTLSVVLQDVLDTVGRERVIENITAVTAYKIAMLAEHADQSVTDHEVCESTINFIQHQIAYKMLLDFVGTQSDTVSLETPILAFSKLGKINISKRLLWKMFSSNIYSDILPLDEQSSKGLLSTLRSIVSTDPVFVHVRDRTQNSLLHWVARLPLVPEVLDEVLRFLVENGCDLEARNSTGATPVLDSTTPAAALSFARLGACLNVVRIDGWSFTDLHPDWVPLVLQELAITDLPQPESISIVNIMIAAPNILPPAVVPPATVGSGGSGSSGSTVSGAPAPSPPPMPLALKFIIMSMIPVPYGSLFSFETPVFPWLKRDTEEKFGEESWPLVPMGDVEGSEAGKNTLAHVCVKGLTDDKMMSSCTLLIGLYDIGNADSLDYEQILESMSRTQAINKFLIGVGSDVRSDKAAITKYWEQRALPVRLEDAIRVGRLLRVTGFSECESTCTDVYNVLYATIHFYASRVFKASSTEAASGEGGTVNNEKRIGNTRIKVLTPMQIGTEPYESVKMLVLGHEEAGKTSLLDSLSEKHSWKSFSKAIWKKRTAQTKSTVGINKMPLTIGEVSVNAYDFGGQLEYHAIHEYFLSPHNAMYLVVIDGSNERLTEQLSYWLQLLHSHSKGPRGTCVLFVVCTKEDVIEKHFGTDAVTAKRSFLKDYLSRWPSLRKIADPEVFMISNKTGVGIKALRDAIKDRLRVLSKTMITKLTLNAMNALSKSVVPFMSFNEFMQFLTNNKVLSGGMPLEHSRQLVRDILDSLHNSGNAVVSSGYDTICCRPELMSEILSSFVAPTDHLKRFMNMAGYQRKDVFTRTELVNRFMSIGAVSNTEAPEKLCDKIISAFEDMKFCFPLPPEARPAYNLAPTSEQCYLFPSLCDPVDYVALPYNETADRVPDILRIVCHGYECSACRTRYAAGDRISPPEGGFCPNCGCAKFVHVCLNEPLGATPMFTGSLHREMYCEYLPVIQQASSNYMWTCLLCSEGTNQTVTIPKTCPCVMQVAPVVKYVACIVNSMLEQGINASQFNRVAVQLRRYMHPRFRLFRNFVVFRDIYGNVVLATLFTNGNQTSLGIISRGSVPHLWADTLHPLLTLGEAVVPACPACAHVNTFTPLHPAPTEGPDAIPGAAEAGIMVCDNGHIVSSDQVNMGMQRNEQLCTESSLWGPKKSVAFYKESEQLWNTDPRYPNAAFTELTSVELSSARQLEYIYARSLFYKFVGTDPANSQFTLTKVVFIENKTVEAMFARKFSEFAARAYSASDSGAAAAKKDDSSKKSGADKTEWQQWILAHLGKCVERVCGNEQINLVGGWHGTIDKSAHGIANTNFYMPAENKSSKDPGYFGKGVYFTQSPSYGVEYAVFSANVTKNHAKEGSSYNEEDITPCLVFSWILLGRVYPVTEPAEVNNPASLMGKGCVEGYDSHYVVLPQQARGSNNALTKPYNYKSLFDTPGCDEIVVFDKAQILPRYIFYYENNDRVSNVKSGFLSLDVRDAKTVILWVDDEITAHYMIILQTYIKKAVPNVAIVTMVSSSELKSWLHQYGQEVEDKIVIITNAFRANDGEANAAWRVINEVRKGAKLKKVPILVFRKKRTDQIEYFAKMKLVYIANNDAELLLFIQQRKL